jgi:flagellar basal body-associated protein FliL
LIVSPTNQPVMKKRVITIVLLIFILVIAGVVYYRYYFVFGDGTKAGTMNYFVHKGVMFKTYEGRLIQAGIKTPAQGTIQSNEFMFSVDDQKVAQKLNNYAGAYLELHYKEYFHTLPWRGVSTFVVDSIVSVQKVNPAQP